MLLDMLSPQQLGTTLGLVIPPLFNGLMRVKLKQSKLPEDIEDTTSSPLSILQTKKEKNKQPCQSQVTEENKIDEFVTVECPQENNKMILNDNAPTFARILYQDRTIRT